MFDGVTEVVGGAHTVAVELSVVAFGGGDAEAVAVGNWSGAVRSAGSRPMASAYRAAKWCDNALKFV